MSGISILYILLDREHWKLMTKRRKTVPLIIEHHPETYDGFEFITVIKYNKEYYLTIVDNIDNKNIQAYMLDMCMAEGVNEELIISITNEWYNSNNENYPISVEFSKHNITEISSKIYRSFTLSHVSRIIGPVYSFEMSNSTVKKRKKKLILPEYINKKNS